MQPITYFHEPCVCSREGIGDASVVVRMARAIEQRTDRLFVGGTAPGKPVGHRACPESWLMEKQLARLVEPTKFPCDNRHLTDEFALFDRGGSTRTETMCYNLPGYKIREYQTD